MVSVSQDKIAIKQSLAISKRDRDSRIRWPIRAGQTSDSIILIPMFIVDEFYGKTWARGKKHTILTASDYQGDMLARYLWIAIRRT